MYLARIRKLQSRLKTMMTLLKQRDELLGHCVKLLSLSRPDIHEEALKQLNLSQKDFDDVVGPGI